MKVALYARVSTDDQSPEMQLVALREYAKVRGFTVYKEYVDIGISGMAESRPAFDQLTKDAFQRKIDAIMVWKLDRFSRSLRHLLIWLTEFQHYGVAFISYSENIDLTTAAGRFMMAMMGAFAEFEREIIKERVTAGVRRAMSKRATWGRKAIQVDLQRIQGLTIRQGAKILGVSHETVRRARKAIS